MAADKQPQNEKQARGARREPLNSEPAPLAPRASELPLLDRARLVLMSQGRAPSLADGMSEALQQRLAACSMPDGTILPAAVEGVRLVISDYYQAMKATVDDDGATHEFSEPEPPAA